MTSFIVITAYNQYVHNFQDLKEARNRKGEWPGREALQNFVVYAYNSCMVVQKYAQICKKLTNSHFPLQFSNRTYSAWNIPFVILHANVNCRPTKRNNANQEPPVLHTFIFWKLYPLEGWSS
jgi:hypothetical protein